MVYQFVQYLIDNIIDVNFIANGANSSSQENLVIVSDTGGTVDHYTGRQDVSIQFLSRSKNNFVARAQSEKVFSLVNNVFGLLLPQTTVGGTLFPAVKTYRIVSVQAPGYIGASNDNYEMYSFNVIVTLDYS